MGVYHSILKYFGFNLTEADWIAHFEKMSPEELLKYVLDHPEACKLCEKHNKLRQTCILAAVRRHHKERLIDGSVYDRTAPYMILLDRFLRIEDAFEASNLNDDLNSFFFYAHCHGE